MGLRLLCKKGLFRFYIMEGTLQQMPVGYDLQQVKNDMMRLWKETFHDTDRYVGMIFDAYFDPRLCLWSYEEKKLVSALVGVPYSFKSTRGELRGLYLCGLATDPRFRGNGLMSRMIEEANERALSLDFDFTFLIPADAGLRKYYEDRGYSSAMRNVVERFTSGHNFYREYALAVKRGEKRLRFNRLRNFENLLVWKIEKRGNGLSFEDLTENERQNNLEKYIEEFAVVPLPSEDNGDNGEALNKITVLEKEIESDEEFDDLDELEMNSKEVAESSADSMADSIVSNLLENAANDNEIIVSVTHEFNLLKTYEFVKKHETGYKNLTLFHSLKDFILVAEDLLNSGGEIMLLTSKEHDVSAIAFLENNKDKIKVRRVIAESECSYFRMLHEIVNRWPDLPLEVVKYPSEVEGRRTISDLYYGAAMPEATNVPAIGYAEKVVSSSSLAQNYGMARILRFSNFMEFAANNKGDSKFSILMNDPRNDTVTRFSSSRGKGLECEEFSKEEFGSRQKKQDEMLPVILSRHQLQSLLLRRWERDDAVLTAFGLPAIEMNMALLLD